MKTRSIVSAVHALISSACSQYRLGWTISGFDSPLGTLPRKSGAEWDETMANNDFRVFSNFREIGSFDTLDQAKRFALTESNQFDDIVRIDGNGSSLYFAQYGTLYRAHILRDI
jgi:hypothetical protein